MNVKIVEVVKGDTLWGLAERHTGSGKNWRDVYKYNAVALADTGRAPSRIGPDFIWPGDQIAVVTNVEFEESGN